MSIITKKEKIEFLEIPADVRCKILIDVANKNIEKLAKAKDPNHEWGERIWDELGENEFGFFWAMRAFEKAIEKAIEIDQEQLEHWNITNEDLEQIFEKDQMSFYILEGEIIKEWDESEN